MPHILPAAKLAVLYAIYNLRTLLYEIQILHLSTQEKLYIYASGVGSKVEKNRLKIRLKIRLRIRLRISLRCPILEKVQK